METAFKIIEATTGVALLFYVIVVPLSCMWDTISNHSRQKIKNHN